MMTLRRPDIADLICVVEIDDGRILIKKIQPGKARGLFHLVSRREEPILNVRIDWASRVKNMVPNKWFCR